MAFFGLAALVVFPTRVGVILAENELVAFEPSIPHTCGGDPAYCVALFFATVYSPHM